MTMDTNTLAAQMVAAGQGLAGTVWQDIQTYVEPELEKIAAQIVAIEAAMLQPDPPYTQDGAKALLDMQVRAVVGVVVAMTTLTLEAAQTAINAILAAVGGAVNAAIGFPLIA